MVRRTVIVFLKISVLALVASMALMQVRELSYDFGPHSPVEVKEPGDLDRVEDATFAVVRGAPDFSNAFVYRRYGLDHSYFTVKPYGMRLVVRTYDEITDEWRGFNSFVGRLRPFDRQPFSRYVAAIYLERFGVPVPKDAYFLALDDVPGVSGWQVGSLVLVGLIWAVLLWFFFIRGRVVRIQPSFRR